MNDLKKAISKEGLIKALCALVSKKTITMEQALEECGLTEEVFVEKMKNMGWISSLVYYEKSPVGDFLYF